MPNMVLLEESEPNTIYDALTAPTISHGTRHPMAWSYPMVSFEDGFISCSIYEMQNFEPVSYLWSY